MDEVKVFRSMNQWMESSCSLFLFWTEWEEMSLPLKHEGLRLNIKKYFLAVGVVGLGAGYQDCLISGQCLFHSDFYTWEDWLHVGMATSQALSKLRSMSLTESFNTRTGVSANLKPLCPTPPPILRHSCDRGWVITSSNLPFWHSRNTTIAYVGYSGDRNTSPLKFIKRFSVGLLLPKVHLIKLRNFLTAHLFLMMYFRSHYYLSSPFFAL